MAEKTYQEIQDEAELLGITPLNQKKEELISAIANLTGPEAVGKLIASNKAMVTAAQESQAVIDAQVVSIDNLRAAVAEKAETIGDVETIIAPGIALLNAQMADLKVRTVPYRTGLANGMKLFAAAVRGVVLEDDQLLTPVTQVAQRGAPRLTERELLIKEATVYITNQKGKFALRSGLTGDQIKRSAEVMKLLGVEKGSFVIPAE